MEEELKEELKRKAFAFALENALKHEGKALVEAVIPKLFREGLKKEQLKEAVEIVKETVEKVNSLSLEEQEKEFEKVAYLIKRPEKKEGLPELPNAKKGKVVMRFAPFPSGPLHLGNAKTAILNDEYCKKYEGKLLLVIDDTIGSEEKKIVEEAYKLIPEALDWLNVKYEKPIIYKSDRLAIYYEYAKKLIETGKAYVCFCDVETLRNNRTKGIECEHRNHSIEENLSYFDDMIKGKYKEGEAVLRIKTDMKHQNPAFRDRVLFRITERKHPRVKAKLWPLLEFSWAIDDYLLGITHILRGKDLMMESEMERYIWKVFGWKGPEIIHTGLIQVEGVKISKTKASKEVTTGSYFGWDDPRTFSIQSLRRRGFVPEAVRNFCLKLGVAEREPTVPIEVLYAENKKYVEKSNRYFFVHDPVKIKIKGAPKLKAKLPLHPDHPERGYRNFKTEESFYITKDDFEKLKKGKVYRLMNLLNFVKNTHFSFISTKLDKSLDAKLIHWLPADEKQIVACEVLMPDGSIKKGFAEKRVELLKEGTIVQFERFGFCRLDKKEKNKVCFWFAHK